MKLLLKILAGLLILVVVTLVALNLYFTDERLKSMILPELREVVGTEIEVENMSLTFFKTFPQMGVELNGFVLPDPDGNPVARLEELVVGIQILKFLNDEISISELQLIEPFINYHVFEDGSSNIDFLLDMAGEEDVDETDDSGYSITIPNFSISTAAINYRDDTANMFVEMKGLNAEISLEFADLIESSVNAQLENLNVVMDSVNYISDLSLSLRQTSTIDLENEQLNVSEGTLSIRGLALNVHGNISDWGSESLQMNLEFASSSENFGELLRLAPPEYDEYLTELETRGALDLKGSVSGIITEEEIPAFTITLKVDNGYIKNPDLPEAIEDIQIQLTANNDVVEIQRFDANAAGNAITASGRIDQPLEENAVFSLDFDGDVDLATISQFYPLDEFGIENLSGTLAANATANGNLSTPENAEFSGNFTLRNGILKYAEVPQAIENINANIEANQNLIDIKNTEFSTADNSFSMAGTISNPLDENNRSVNVSADLDFDLATIKNFYPIDEDTLSLRGKLTANVKLQGKVDMDQPERLLQNSTFNLSNGYISHNSVAKPLEDLTLSATATGSQISIKNASFRTGENTLAVNGSVRNYLSENPAFDLNIKGDAVLADLTAYYSLEPWIQTLGGTADLNLRATGAGANPADIELNGALILAEVNADGDSLPLPVTDLNGTFQITGQKASLKNFAMKFGSSDINLDGEMQHYMAMLDEDPSQNQRPNLTGNYSSNLLNLDEMIDWDAEESEEPIFIELPEMNATVSANISRLVIFGLDITEISGTGKMNPDEIRLENAQASLFDGTASGNLLWEVPAPDRTIINFSGKLDNLTAEAFFRDTGFLGENSNIHQYVTGAFSADLQYTSALDEMMSPDMSTASANGSFGMTRARLNGHPIQEKVADFLKVKELSSVALDSWEASFSISEEIMTFKDFNLTSENIGLELNGTQNLLTDEIDYHATISLPERFKRGIATVISNQAADALQRDDGTIAVPLRITGTLNNPIVRPDDTVIKQLIQDYLKNQGGRLLDRLFGDN